MPINSSQTYPGQNGSISVVDDEGIPYFPRYGHTIIAAILTLTGCFGFIENVLVQIIFLKHKTLRSPTNMFIRSVSLCDLGMATIGIPFSVSASIRGYWYLGHRACVFSGFLFFFLGLTNMYCLTAVSIDRYIVITKPFLASKITPSVAFAATLCGWCGGLIWSALPLIGWGEYGPEGSGASCGLNWDKKDAASVTYVALIFVFCLLVPASIMAYSYYNIYMTVITVNKASTATSNSLTRNNKRLEQKMAITVFLMLAIFLLNWIPYAIVSFWAAFGDASGIPIAVKTVPAIVAKTCVIWNPIIYVATNKRFRKPMFDLIFDFKVNKVQVAKRNSYRSEKEEDIGKKGQLVTPCDLSVIAKSRPIELSKSLQRSKCKAMSNDAIEIDSPTSAQSEQNKIGTSEVNHV